MGRGVADLLHRQCGVANLFSRQRPVGNEALDRVRPADRLCCSPVGLGALLRAVRSSRPVYFDRRDDFAVASGSEGKVRDEGL